MFIAVTTPIDDACDRAFTFIGTLFVVVSARLLEEVIRSLYTNTIAAKTWLRVNLLLINIHVYAVTNDAMLVKNELLVASCNTK